MIDWTVYIPITTTHRKSKLTYFFEEFLLLFQEFLSCKYVIRIELSNNRPNKIFSSPVVSKLMPSLKISLPAIFLVLCCFANYIWMDKYNAYALLSVRIVTKRLFMFLFTLYVTVIYGLYLFCWPCWVEFILASVVTVDRT